VHDSVVVSTELRIVAGNQLESGKRALTKLFNQISIAEITLNFPVRSDRAEIDNSNMPTILGVRGRRGGNGRHKQSFDSQHNQSNETIKQPKQTRNHRSNNRTVLHRPETAPGFDVGRQRAKQTGSSQAVTR
jgi:hypothetical protein